MFRESVAGLNSIELDTSWMTLREDFLLWPFSLKGARGGSPGALTRSNCDIVVEGIDRGIDPAELRRLYG